jgi:hypothetical protein
VAVVVADLLDHKEPAAMVVVGRAEAPELQILVVGEAEHRLLQAALAVREEL